MNEVSTLGVSFSKTITIDECSSKEPLFDENDE